MVRLQINDPVHVEQREGGQLEGVVAFLGPVKFADGSDWVGVRLTGSSIGQGKNDGSVKGHRYFSTFKSGGVFVKKSHVTLRSLTRLEALRLKRELAKSTGSSMSSTSSSTISSAASRAKSMTISSSASASKAARSVATPRMANTSTKSSRLTTPSKLSSSLKQQTQQEHTSLTKDATPGSAAKRSRLDAIRERRAQLQRSLSNLSNMSDNNSRTSSRASSPVATDSAPNLALQQQIDGLQTQLATIQATHEKAMQTVEKEKSALQETLDVTRAALRRAQEQGTVRVTSEHVQGEMEEYSMQILGLEQKRSELLDLQEKSRHDLEALEQELERERQERAAETAELVRLESELSATKHDLLTMQDQTTARTSSDASHYKERAKLQAELSAAKRSVEQLENEKIDLEGQVEDLILDKEQLLEEKEILQDRTEELKIDAETAQMEVEELKIELEDAKSSTAAGGTTAVVSGSSEDAAQALATQNARLREALIRLREQTSIEKIDHTRQLRVAEKQAAEGQQLMEEVKSLREAVKTRGIEIEELKEMVEQGSALESMVEDLSDRVMALEDDNVGLQSTIREMEEAADIAAELEEVQAEEVKALMRDLEGRDAIVRNLEEAIKMQRRREEDFQRTVGNYRKTVDTLKQEKNELLTLQRGNEGEKSEMFATSQKALSRAAQLVANAENARRREARAAFFAIDAQVQRHLSERLESMFPQSVVSSELASIKGELLLCNVIGKASKTLEEMSLAFERTIRSGIHEALAAGDESVAEDAVLQLSDEAVQGIENMLHQTKVSLSAVEMSSSLLRLLAAGQWPDVLSTETSADLGAMVGHTLVDLDMNIGLLLKILIEEGSLSPHRSNLGAFQQSIQTCLQTISTTVDVSGKQILSDDWSPPGWKLLKDASVAKFSCLGAGAAIAAVINPDDSSGGIAKSGLKTMMTKLEHIGGEALKMGPRLSSMDIMNEKVVRGLEGDTAEWNASSLALFGAVTALLEDKNEFEFCHVNRCREAADAVLRSLTKLSSSLRAADLTTDVGTHALAPESLDCWTGVTVLAETIRSIDGDRDDVHYMIRSRAVESRLAQAVANEPKLLSANSKITSLEKTLDSRAKEIAMQNVRLSELEKLLAKSNIPASPASRSTTAAPKVVSASDELIALKEENRVLTEAMDVLQHQVDEYELEIKILKDPKSPRPRVTGTPRASRASSPMFTPRMARGGGFDDLYSLGTGGPTTVAIAPSLDSNPASIAALQAALFRPELELARRQVSALKAKAVANDVLKLPPLETTVVRPLERQAMVNLERVRAKARLDKVSLIRLVDLTSKTSSASAQLVESVSKLYQVDERVRNATREAAVALSNSRGNPVTAHHHDSYGALLGKISVPSQHQKQQQEGKKVPVLVNQEDITRLHMHLLKAC